MKTKNLHHVCGSIDPLIKIQSDGSLSVPVKSLKSSRGALEKQCHGNVLCNAQIVGAVRIEGLEKCCKCHFIQLEA